MLEKPCLIYWVWTESKYRERIYVFVFCLKEARQLRFRKLLQWAHSSHGIPESKPYLPNNEFSYFLILYLVLHNPKAFPTFDKNVHRFSFKNLWTSNLQRILYGKIWGNVPNRLAPPPAPPPIGYFRLFWISDFFEKGWPLLSDQFQTFVNLRTYWWRKTPWTNILKGLFRHIYIEKGQIKCFNFSFLRWGLRVTYNSDIFKKLRPPLSV